MKKGISPIFAAALIIALTVTFSLVVNSFISSLSGQQREKIEDLRSCSGARIKIESVACENDLVRIYVKNTGSVQLGNFSVYIKMGNHKMINETPSLSKDIINPGEFALIETRAPYSGLLERVEITSKLCPGVKDTFTSDIKEVYCE